MNGPETCLIRPHWASLASPLQEIISPEGRRKLVYEFLKTEAGFIRKLRLMTNRDGSSRNLFILEERSDNKHMSYNIDVVTVDNKNRLYRNRYSLFLSDSTPDRLVGRRTAKIEIEPLSQHERKEDFYNQYKLHKEIDFGVALSDFMEKIEKTDLTESYNLPEIISPQQVDRYMAK